MATYFHRLLIRCPHCGESFETHDSREFDDEDDLFMYTSGVVRGGCRNCGEMIEVTDSMYRNHDVTICELEKYEAFLNRNLLNTLGRQYNAPDRASWKYGKTSTTDWYGTFIRRMYLYAPDNPVFNEAYELLNAVQIYGAWKLKHLEVPHGTTRVTAGMARFPKYISSVYLPDHLQAIGEGAFKGFTYLEDIFLPRTVERIEREAFADSGLRKIRTADLMKVIGPRAFAGCRHLETFFFPDGLEEIGEFAFEGCTSLKKIFVPNSVKHIGAGAFRGCTGLVQAEIPDIGIDLTGIFESGVQVTVFTKERGSE